ncbi:probable inactive histone-lysine N-methyltransferase SUVR2 [Daucus carota subsp. sativus]|uniref:probable inactive histone-lysine N-methyltransferase SUVR2 n=1 Tax=Daucus carota subsp. sativus TaxID=79200 RepID=UPI0007EF32A9|nr:PREDICTED: probable inactive histone-lysine N-methyltransferase SUVR2 [Daucus carota subsp. sativus]XP_017229777.1 PREDICTED: probable inactive histone-lysine N-methyltransferase SUVR2 [Daucus carota subsp. sativus]
MAPNPRVLKAFRAMKAIGILEDKVKPVLKDLLKLYDKNWEHIEEENYRALADAILERDEMEAASEKNKNLGNSNDDENLEHDEPDRPLKRLRLKHQDNHLSSSLIDGSPDLGVGEFKKPKVEADEASAREITNPEPQSVSLQPLAKDKGKQPVSSEAGAPVISVPSHSSLIRSKDKGKEPLLPEDTPKDFRLFSERSSSHGVTIREPKVDAVISLPPKKVPNGYALTKLNDSSSIDEKLHADVAATAVHPEPLPDGRSTVENVSVPDPTGQTVLSFHSVIDNDENNDIPDFASEKRINSELVKSQCRSNPDFDVTTAPCGDTGVSVSDCSTLGKPEVQYVPPPLNGADNIQPDAAVVSPQEPISLPPCSGMNGSPPHDNRMVNHYEVNSDRALTVNNSTNCQSLMAVQKPQAMLNNGNSVHDVNDLSKGQEKVVVYLQNEINSECQLSFNYIPENVIFQKAHVNISLAHIRESCCSKCSGDCLSSSTPCACADENNGEYAYTSEGLVKEKLLEECISIKREPQNQILLLCKECPLERLKNEEKIESCKGHLMRKFIKECWWKCGCSKNCGNRVVQRGIDRKLQVFMTVGGKGWGLRTLESLPKGAFVCEYVGEVITNSELCDRVLQGRNTGSHQYSVPLDANWSTKIVLKDEEALCLDATHYGNVARFINHRCVDSNLIEIPVEVETPDRHYYHLAFFTTREVKALEELTWDYGIDFDDHDRPISTFECLCGSNFCRNINRTRSASEATAT